MIGVPAILWTVIVWFAAASGEIVPVPEAVKAVLPQSLTAGLEINAGFLCLSYFMIIDDVKCMA